MLCLGDDIYVYPFVSQGKITVPSIDDFEEMKMTHVRLFLTRKVCIVFRMYAFKDMNHANFEYQVGIPIITS